MDLRNQIGSGENIYWSGKKSIKVSVLEAIFNKMLPIALIWALFDGMIIRIISSGGSLNGQGFLGGFLSVFFLIHLMPVWIYIGGVITSAMSAKNTEYIITDKGIYTQTGILGKRVNMKPFADMAYVSVNQGVFDRICKTGDIICICEHGQGAGGDILNIEDYERIFKIVKELQENIYSDTMFPNDLRPQENHGYKTKYVISDHDNFGQNY